MGRSWEEAVAFGPGLRIGFLIFAFCLELEPIGAKETAVGAELDVCDDTAGPPAVVGRDDDVVLGASTGFLEGATWDGSGRHLPAPGVEEASGFIHQPLACSGIACHSSFDFGVLGAGSSSSSELSFPKGGRPSSSLSAAATSLEPVFAPPDSQWSIGQAALGCGPLHLRHTWAIGQLAPALHGGLRFQFNKWVYPRTACPSRLCRRP